MVYSSISPQALRKKHSLGRRDVMVVNSKISNIFRKFNIYDAQKSWVEHQKSLREKKTKNFKMWPVMYIFREQKRPIFRSFLADKSQNQLFLPSITVL